MIKLILILALLVESICEPILFSWDLEALKRLRSLDKQQKMESRAVSSSLLKLWKETNKDLERLSAQNFPSVYQKNSTVYGTAGDKSFYSSVVPYAFPCNRKPLGCRDYSGNEYNGSCAEDGLPWVICDGSFNHEAAAMTDRPEMDKMMHYVMRLSLSGFIFGERQKSAAAAEVLRTWFLRNETKMQPNLKFGQGIPGVVQGRGSASMDMYFSGRGFIDSVQLLGLTPNITEIWTYRDRAGFTKWASEFSNYMYSDPEMVNEKKARNNHGVYYDLNVLAWAQYAGETEIIKRINGTSDCFWTEHRVYDCLSGRFPDQINGEGVLIHEIVRADHSHYVWYTLLANAYLATAGAKLNNFAGFREPFLLKATDWALSYVTAEPGSKVEGNHIYAAHAYRMMSRGTRNEKYELAVCDVLTKLSEMSLHAIWAQSKVGTHVLNIVMPSVHKSIDKKCGVWKNYKALHESEAFLRAAKRNENGFAPRGIPANKYELRLESNYVHILYKASNMILPALVGGIFVGSIFAFLTVLQTKKINSRKKY